MVCYIRTYIIILVGIFPSTSTNQNIGRDVSPNPPAGLTPVEERPLIVNVTGPLEWAFPITLGVFLARGYIVQGVYSLNPGVAMLVMKV